MPRATQILFIVLIAVLAIVTGCNTKTEVPGSDNYFFIEFDADDSSIKYEDGVDNYGNGPGINSYPDYAARLHSQLTTYIRNALRPLAENDILTIQMVEFLQDSSDFSYSTSFQMFEVGSYSYGSWKQDSTHLGIDGAVIQYTDAEGRIWSSDKLYGEQKSWASFELSSDKAVEETLFGGKTKGTFNCLVFDGSGGSLELRNGTFHARTIFRHD
jgi:hypothetical protein